MEFLYKNYNRRIRNVVNRIRKTVSENCKNPKNIEKRMGEIWPIKPRRIDFRKVCHFFIQSILSLESIFDFCSATPYFFTFMRIASYSRSDTSNGLRILYAESF